MVGLPIDENHTREFAPTLKAAGGICLNMGYGIKEIQYSL